MSPTSAPEGSPRRHRLRHPWYHALAVCAIGAGLLMGCSKPADEAAAGGAQKSDSGDKAEKPEASGNEKTADREVKLAPEDASRMGVTVAAINASSYQAEVEGYGVVMGHDVIAQAVADLATAAAAARQSAAVLARMQRLAGTPGADPPEAREDAQRRASSDQTAMTLAQRKLSALLGQHPPWSSDDSPLLQDAAVGRVKLARVTFPLGSLQGVPHELRLARLDAPTVTEQWRTRTVWEAPADATLPGRSFFALIDDANAAEGSRLQAWAAGSAPSAQQGAWVPAASAVASAGTYWCYIQSAPGTFERKPLDISRPLRDGYFVTDLKPGASVVTAGAGLLLARELNPDTEAE